MNKLIYMLLIVFSCKSFAFTETLSFPTGDSEVIVATKRHQDMQITTVSIGTEEIFNLKLPAISQRFSRAEVIENYLILIFVKGVHGETIKVLDLIRERIVLDSHSAWPVELEKQGQRLAIRLSDASQTDFSKPYEVKYLELQ